MEERTKKPGFVTYIDDLNRMMECGATADQIGRLMIALSIYAETGERPELDPDISMGFALLSCKIDRDNEAYEKKARAGRQGGQANASTDKQTEANASTDKQTEADASKPKQTQANGSTVKEKNQKKKELKQDIEQEQRARTRVREIGFVPAARARTETNDYLQRNDDMSDVLLDL